MTSIRKNYLYNLLTQILVMVLPVVTTPYLSRVLGETNLGIYNYALSIVNFFILFGCVGLNVYGQREIAACREDRFARSRIFFELLTIRAVTLSLSIAAFVFVLLPRVDYPRIYWILGIELFASLFDVGWYFQGREEFRMQSLRTLVTRVISVTCVFVFVRDEGDLEIFCVCYALSLFLGNFSLVPPLRRELQRVPRRTLRFKRHFLPIFWMFLPQAAANVYTQLDRTMIGLLTGHNYAEVTYYSQAEKIVKLSLSLITAIGSIMLSRVAAVLAENENDRAKAYIEKSFRFMLLLGLPITVGLAAVAEDFVPWFFGEGYDPVTPCMALLSPLVLIISTSNILGTQYLLPARRMRDYTLSIVCGMTVNILCNALLIPRFGAKGAVVATLFAETVVCAAQFIFLRGIFSPALLLRQPRCIPAAAAMGAAVWGLSRLLPGRIWATAVEVAVGAAVYFGLVLLFRDPFLLEQLGAVRAALRGKLKKG